MTKPTHEQPKAKSAQRLPEQQRGSVTFEVNDKGGVTVYGFGLVPVVLYYEQWIRLLENAQGLRTFLEANKSKLKLKFKPKRGRIKNKQEDERVPLADERVGGVLHQSPRKTDRYGVPKYNL